MTPLPFYDLQEVFFQRALADLEVQHLLSLCSILGQYGQEGVTDVFGGIGLGSLRGLQREGIPSSHLVSQFCGGSQEGEGSLDQDGQTVTQAFHLCHVVAGQQNGLSLLL